MTAEIPEGLELHRNGTVTIVVDGNQQVHLRRPKMGEFRRLREAYQEASDRVTTSAHQLQAEAVALSERAKESPEDPAVGTELLALQRRIGRQIEDASEHEWVGWFRLVVATLGDANFPDDDDCPVWMGQAKAVGELLGHWKAVPTPRGVH